MEVQNRCEAEGALLMEKALGLEEAQTRWFADLFLCLCDWCQKLSFNILSTFVS